MTARCAVRGASVLLLVAGCAQVRARGAADVAVLEAPSPREAEPNARELPATTPGPLGVAQMEAVLAGWGGWFDSERYGRVWRPDASAVARDFVPFLTQGAWVPAAEGWYWASELPWGLVTFHYGRWVRDDGAWSWVPGARFAPAWVEWREGGGWTAWAPRGPEGADAWAPLVYCARGALAGPGLIARVVQGEAAGSLYVRTSSVPGPEATRAGASAGAASDLWRAEVARLDAARREAFLAPVPATGLPDVPRVEVVVEAPAPAPPPRSREPVVVLRDRDLEGMEPGPSVRRPPEPAGTVPPPSSTVVDAVTVQAPRAPDPRADTPVDPQAPVGTAWSDRDGPFPIRGGSRMYFRGAPSWGPGAGASTLIVAPRRYAAPVRSEILTGVMTSGSGTPGGSVPLRSSPSRRSQ